MYVICCINYFLEHYNENALILRPNHSILQNYWPGGTSNGRDSTIFDMDLLEKRIARFKTDDSRPLEMSNSVMAEMVYRTFVNEIHERRGWTVPK